jgi:Ca2+:H+ antiporter
MSNPLGGALRSWPTWAPPLAALIMVGLEHAHVFDAETIWVVVVVGLLMLGSVFAAVHHAEVIGHKVGEPFGSIILALAVTVIEASLIITAMLTAGGHGNTLVRDTVFSAVMIVLNGLVGICLLVGGLRHHEQAFRVQGTASALSVLATLAILTLVLPNYTVTKLGPQYSPTQLLFISAFSIVLYGVFVFVQSVRHRDHFTPQGGGADLEGDGPSISAGLAAASSVLLIVSLAAVVLVAETLTPRVEAAILDVGLPPSFLGVVIAALVLLPESGTALKAAYQNRVQTSLNLAMGSALATIGLTVSVVGALSLYLQQELTLGLDAEGMALLLLTLFVSTLTLATGRATILQGAVHLVIFGAFLLLAAVP